MDDPSDADIEALLRAVPDAAWDELAAAADAVAATDVVAEWRGGEVRTEVIAGVETPVHQMPYPVYSDEVDRLHAALGGVGAVVPFDWMQWPGVQTYRGGNGMAAAPVADAVRMVTAVIRSERFGDGSIAAAIEDGTLLAAVDRLRAWHEGDRGGR